MWGWKRNTAGPDDGDRGERWVLAQIPLLLLAFIVPSVGSATVAWPAGTQPPRAAAGFCAGTSGASLLALGLLHLGRNLTPFPRPRAEGALVTTGVYGLVRHPIYGGLVLLALAFGLRGHTWLALPVDALVFLFFARKARAEEKWLRERFPDYHSYQERTAKLLPWIY